MLALVAVLALVAAHLIRRPLIARPPRGLAAINYRGKAAPAVGGLVVFLPSLALEALLAVVVPAHAAGCGPVGVLLGFGGPSCGPRAAFVVVLAGMFTAGLIDDAAGKEPERGLRGHLGAMLRGTVTAGAVKAGAGVAFGLLAGRLLAPDLPGVFLAGACVALSANLMNLLDRAPGRAGKIFFLAWLPQAVLSPAYLAVSLVPAAAAAAWLPADLHEKGMLGDSGAYLLGGLIGLGLATSFGNAGKLVAVAVLAGLTFASEVASFSRGIEAARPLRWLDGLGRRGGTRSG